MSPKNKQQKRPNKGVAKAPLAGPSAPIAAEAPPQQTFGSFGTAKIATSSFDFLPSNDEETNALARLNHKQKELDDANQHYHDLLVERDQRIEELEKAATSKRTEQSNVRKERDDLARDVRGYKETTEAAVAAKEKAEKDLALQKGAAEFDRQDAEALRKSSREKDQNIIAQKKLAVKFEERLSEQAATLQELHKRVDDAEAEKQTLQIANSNLALQQEGTAKDVAAATKEFEDMFKDLGRELDLHGYVGHVRDLLGSGQLKRQDSSHSLQRQLSPPISTQDFPAAAGKSLMDQLAAAVAADDSSERSVPATDDPDEEDETLTALGLNHTFTEHDYFCQLQRQEQRIVELEKLNAELQAQPASAATSAVSQDDATQTDSTMQNDSTTQTASKQSDSTTQTDGPIAPISAQPTSQNFGLSSIQTLDTKPIKGEAQQKAKTKIVYYPTRCSKPHAMPKKLAISRGTSPIEPISATTTPQTLVGGGATNALATAPAVGETTNPSSLYKLFLFLMLAINAFLLVTNGTERWVWLSANDTTREAVLRAGASTGLLSLLSPVLAAVDRVVGLDNALMG